MSEQVDVERLRAVAQWLVEQKDYARAFAVDAAAAEITALRAMLRSIIGDYEVLNLDDETDEQIMARAKALWALKSSAEAAEARLSRLMAAADECRTWETMDAEPDEITSWWKDYDAIRREMGDKP
jgi:hypothetical protein